MLLHNMVINQYKLPEVIVFGTRICCGTNVLFVTYLCINKHKLCGGGVTGKSQNIIVSQGGTYDK